MKHVRKHIIMYAAVLMVTVVLLPLNALDVRWRWPAADPSISYFRYQINGEDPECWTVIDGTVDSVLTEGLDPEADNVFYLQSSFDGISWSSSSAIGYDPRNVIRRNVVHERDMRFGARAVLSPYTLGIIDFYNGHDIEGANTFMTTAYGASVDGELFFDVSRNLSFNFCAGYSIIDKPTTVLPDAFTLHYVRLSAGPDIVIPVGQKTRLSIGLDAGALIHMNDEYWNMSSFAGARFLAEFTVSDHFVIGLLSRFSCAYLGNEDPLMKSMTWLIDPLALTMTARF